MKLFGSFAAAVLLAIAGPAAAQSTVFTYQGQLNSGAGPAQGQHDFRFRLFDAASGGTQLGATQCVDNIQVENGVFTALIDFGSQFTTTSQRFIEILVRRDIGQTCADATGYTTLTPRQLITPAPAAMQAKSAFSLAAPDGSPANAVFVDNNGNVGIGTTTPSAPLHIASTTAAINLQDIGPSASQTGFVSYRNATGSETAWVGFGAAGDPDFSIVNARPLGDIVLNPFGGNVGVGTASPAARLDVRGNVKLGNAGQFFASAGEENLRLVRGTVDFDGTVIQGSGFTAQKLDIGKYRVTFSTPFIGVPTFLATSSRHLGDLQVGFAAIDEFAPPTASQATVVIKVFPANDYRDARFDFIAVGVR